VARGSLIAEVLFLLLITGLLVFLNVRHQRIVVLPIPTGPYSVGRTAYDWSDQIREEPFAQKRAVEENS